METDKTGKKEKIDPLARIQEEIKETVRREQEYRELATALVRSGSPVTGGGAGAGAVALTPTTAAKKADINANIDEQIQQQTQQQEQRRQQQQQQQQRVTTPDIGAILLSNDETNSTSSTPSLASSVNSKEESLDEQHSDDSGISASFASKSNNNGSGGNNSNGGGNIKSDNKLKLNKQNFKLNGAGAGAGTGAANSSPVSQIQAQAQAQPQPQPPAQPRRYIGPNCYNLTPEPPKQKLLTTTRTFPGAAHTSYATIPKPPRPFGAFGGARGVMERFIASRGKLHINNASLGATTASNSGQQNGNGLVATINSNIKLPLSVRSMNGVAGSATNNNNTNNGNGNGNGSSIGAGTGSTTLTTPTLATLIKRDADGRPLRRGYVPVELKIQRELKDLKSRESELKKIRRIRQSTPDLLDAMSKEEFNNIEGIAAAADDNDDDSDSDGEHCYGPGKLRSTKSINELSSNAASMSLLSEPDMKFNGCSSKPSQGGMRPAKSLAQLCDLPPEQEAPSSHRLIAKWESLITTQCLKAVRRAVSNTTQIQIQTQTQTS